jgi:hypothetical protein
MRAVRLFSATPALAREGRRPGFKGRASGLRPEQQSRLGARLVLLPREPRVLHDAGGHCFLCAQRQPSHAQQEDPAVHRQTEQHG